LCARTAFSGGANSEKGAVGSEATKLVAENDPREPWWNEVEIRSTNAGGWNGDEFTNSGWFILVCNKDWTWRGHNCAHTQIVLLSNYPAVVVVVEVVLVEEVVVDGSTVVGAMVEVVDVDVVVVDVLVVVLALTIAEPNE
jgi:hypothetical protein